MRRCACSTQQLAKVCAHVWRDEGGLGARHQRQRASNANVGYTSSAPTSTCHHCFSCCCCRPSCNAKTILIAGVPIVVEKLRGLIEASNKEEDESDDITEEDNINFMKNNILSILDSNNIVKETTVKIIFNS